MMETQSLQDSLKGTQKKKKQVLIRKRLDESIANSKLYEKHPFLANTVVPSSGNQNGQGNNPLKKHAFKNAGDMLRRASKILTRNISESKILTQQSQRSIDSNQKSKYISNQRTNAFYPDDNYVCEVEGPQVKMNKQYISFMALTGKVEFDSIIVTNNGNASIYYEWVSLDNEKNYAQTLKDVEQKFFCHHEQNVIKPGEQKKFVFSFLSGITGIFNQEWILNCSPPTTKPLAKIKLSGHSIIIDDHIQWRTDFARTLYEQYVFKGMKEIVHDIVHQVKTPTPPLPDLENPDVCRVEFEEKNKDINLYYNTLVIKWWRDLEFSLYEELHLDPEQQYWDMDVQYLKHLIEKIDDEDQKKFFQGRFTSYEELSKKKPVERSDVWDTIRSKVVSVVENIPEISDQLRRDNELFDYVFIVPSDDEYDEEEEEEKLKQQQLLEKQQQQEQNGENNEQYNEEEEQQEEVEKTEEELQKEAEKEERRQQKAEAKQLKEEEKTKRDEEIAKQKAEWAKKRKKKLTEDEEKKLNQECSEQLSQKVKEYLSDQFIGLESQDQFLRIDQLLLKEKPTAEYFENLMRKMQVKDIDIDGKRVLLKVHLKVKTDPLSLKKKQEFRELIVQQKEEEEKRIEEEKLLQEKLAKEKKKGRRPQPKKKKKEEEAPVEEKKQLDLSFLDEDNLQNIVEQIKFFLDKASKLVMVMTSFEYPTGQYELTKSTKFFFEYLKGKLENPIYFSDQILIENYEEKIETEVFTDNSVLIFENSYFTAEEINFRMGKQVKESVLKEEERVRQEELEEQERLKQEEMVDQQQEEEQQQQQQKQQENQKNKTDNNILENNEAQQQENKIEQIEQEPTDLQIEQNLAKKYDPEDLEEKLIKYRHEDKEEYIEQINQYCTYLVQEDKHNFFSRLTSIVDIQLENNVLGNIIGNEVMTTSYLAYLQRYPYIVFLGGEITQSKLLVLHNLYETADRIILLGEFGVAAYLNQRGIADLSGQFAISEVKRRALQKVIDANTFPELTEEEIAAQQKAIRRGEKVKIRKHVELIVPNDFIISKTPPAPIIETEEEKAAKEKEAKKDKKKAGKDKEQQLKEQQQLEEEQQENIIQPFSPEYYAFLQENIKNWKPSSIYVEMGENEGEIVQNEIEDPLPENHIVLDYGQNTQTAIKDSLCLAKKILWVDELSLVQIDLEQKELQQQEVQQEEENQENQENQENLQQEQQIKEEPRLPVELCITTLNTGKMLFQIQQAKQEHLLVEKQDPLYDYEGDLVTFIYGKDLKKQLNEATLKEEIQKSPSNKKKLQEGDEGYDPDNQDENLDDEQASQRSQSQQNTIQQGEQQENEEDRNSQQSQGEDGQIRKKVKQPNMHILADFQVDDVAFNFRILSGEFVHCFNNISSFQINTTPDIDEGLSFLDDIKLE